jgi:cysteine desulfurase
LSLVRTNTIMSARAYLDHNATTPLRPEARAAVEAAMSVVGNPSSVHAEGRAARRMVEDARERVAALVAAEPSQVVFTSGGSEANVLALAGCDRRRVLVSAVEHSSVAQAVDGAEVIPVDGDGVVQVAALEDMLARSQEPAVVSVMLANNETGVVQPVAEIAVVCRRYAAVLHCDAVQAPGKLAIDVRSLGPDLMSLSAHKIGGPAGCGALIVTPELAIRPLHRGGGQERRLRAGTENLLGIAGFGAAAEQVIALPDAARLALLRDRLERRLREACRQVKVLGDTAPRLPNTSCIAMPGMAAETQVIAFDLAGIAVSAGAACSSGKVIRSDVLTAMGIGNDLASSAIRVSLGWTSREADVERFIHVWTDIYSRVRNLDRGAAEDRAPEAQAEVGVGKVTE